MPRGAQRAPKILSKSTKIGRISKPLLKGSQGGPRVPFWTHVGCVLEVFWSYFRSFVEGFLIDVGGMFVSTWEWYCCVILVGFLWEYCLNTVVILWDCCGIVVGMLWDCCGVAVRLL